MPETLLPELVRNIDRRVEAIEQILPTLATKQDLQEAIAPLATREEMHAAIAAAVAPLATREEMRAESETARRHATVLFEDLRDDNRIILEHLVALSARVDQLASR